MRYDGEDMNVGLIMTPDEAQVAREEVVKKLYDSCLKIWFDKHTKHDKVTLSIAQYWNDQASDEIHYWVHSFGNTIGIEWRFWHDYYNRDQPMWACYSHENGSQEFEDDKNFSPAVEIFRDGSFNFLQKQRPWLDGVMSSTYEEYVEGGK